MDSKRKNYFKFRKSHFSINLSLFLILKNGKIFPKFSNKKVSNAQKLNADKSGSTFSIPKSKTHHGQQKNFKSYMKIMKNTRLSGL